MTFCLILSTRQIFEPFFCFNFESRLLLKKGPQFNLNLGQKKVGKNFWIFFYEKTFFSQQTCHSKKMAAHIFVASLHFPSRKNVASRVLLGRASRSDYFSFCVFYAKCKIDFWKVLHSISQMLNYTLHSGAKSPKSVIFLFLGLRNNEWSKSIL